MHCQGTCHAQYAYDIGFAIDLHKAETRLHAQSRPIVLGQLRRAPQRAGDPPQPLQFTQRSTPINIGQWHSDAQLRVVLYNFGALCISYNFAVDGELKSLATLSSLLYDNTELLTDSRRHASEILRILDDSVDKPGICDLVEDYMIFSLREPSEDLNLLIAEDAYCIAAILRGETQPLSTQETSDALTQRLSYGPNDLCVVDWHAALLFGDNKEEERDLLEFANVELLELRHLDWQLDQGLNQAYDILSHQRHGLFDSLSTRGQALQQIARLQADNALFFEGVNNAFKLVGDQYLARVYGITSQRLHLSDWDAAIERKLQTLESIYQKLADRATLRRTELLEWIIIVLIAIEVVAMFWPTLITP